VAARRWWCGDDVDEVVRVMIVVGLVAVRGGCDDVDVGGDVMARDGCW
nr:hypothetical protein [Tanacetum cinerariifolium]